MILVLLLSLTIISWYIMILSCTNGVCLVPYKTCTYILLLSCLSWGNISRLFSALWFSLQSPLLPRNEVSQPRTWHIPQVDELLWPLWGFQRTLPMSSPLIRTTGLKRLKMAFYPAAWHSSVVDWTWLNHCPSSTPLMVPHCSPMRQSAHHILQGDENYVSGSSEPGKMAGRIANIETQQQS